MHYGYFDGACNPNPGKLGLGACIIDEKGNEISAVSLPKGFGTNNEAEYLSLIALLKKAKKIGVKKLSCYGDSRLVINQLIGKYRVSEKFLPYHNEVRLLAESFSFISFEWIRREDNQRADELSKQGLALHNKVKAPELKSENTKSVVSEPVEIDKDYKNRSHVKVLPSGRHRLVIYDNSSPLCVIDIKQMRCSCIKFVLSGTCVHADLASNIKKLKKKELNNSIS